ncbi:hypothetical protein M427DRAFT_68531 [Gonapodya prolifera JEL478]|uniref:Uncharacterized protein n=1 Tax=Gonapodya prolifera (strain JEL478) TaxID=1344416 RepID=A0A139AKX9_GONPJ|nr:hypothetical protein M427DRAFT_68531 [Gonapodya prolifera JEL478]|eukprot:KXS17452.1 hypothetical protein M427DRAFT_68531 [Gonapodya prolifera JEL478]
MMDTSEGEDETTASPFFDSEEDGIAATPPRLPSPHSRHTSSRCDLRLAPPHTRPSRTPTRHDSASSISAPKSSPALRRISRPSSITRTAHFPTVKAARAAIVYGCVQDAMLAECAVECEDAANGPCGKHQ